MQSILYKNKAVYILFKDGTHVFYCADIVYRDLYITA